MINMEEDFGFDEECPYCHALGALEIEEHDDGNLYYCHNCKLVLDQDDYDALNDGEELIFEDDAGFMVVDPREYCDIAVDLEDEDARCICGDRIYFTRDGQYKCPRCKTIYSREEFMSMIGAEPFGPECLTCNNNFPRCFICQHGYKLPFGDEYEEN